MRTIKTYSKGAPFYNAFLRTWDCSRGIGNQQSSDIRRIRRLQLGNATSHQLTSAGEPCLHRCKENSFHQALDRHLRSRWNTWPRAFGALHGHVGRILLQHESHSALGRQYRWIELAPTARVLLSFCDSCGIRRGLGLKVATDQARFPHSENLVY